MDWFVFASILAAFIDGFVVAVAFCSPRWFKDGD